MRRLALADLLERGERRVVLVRPAGGERGAARARPSPPISSGGCGAWTGRGCASRPSSAVVRAGERERRAGPRAVHDLELLGEPVHALAQRREREAVGAVLGLVPARAEAELDAPAGHVVGGRDDLGQLGRVAEGGGGDERAEPQRASVTRGQRADRRPRVERAALGAAAEVEVVVGAEQGRDAVRLAGLARARASPPSSRPPGPRSSGRGPRRRILARAGRTAGAPSVPPGRRLAVLDGVLLEHAERRAGRAVRVHEAGVEARARAARRTSGRRTAA